MSDDKKLEDSKLEKIAGGTGVVEDLGDGDGSGGGGGGRGSIEDSGGPPAGGGTGGESEAGQGGSGDQSEGVN